jgi:hypothetical protein
MRPHSYSNITFTNRRATELDTIFSDEVVEEVDQATELEVVGNINGEVPADMYGDDPF